MPKIKYFSLFIIMVGNILCSLVFANNVFNQEKFDSILNKCKIYLNKYENDSAFMVFEELASMNIPKENLESKANFLGIKGSVEGRKGRHLKQFEVLKQYEDVARKINNNFRIGTSYLSFASYYEQFNDYNNALPFFKEALRYFILAHDELNVAYVYNKLGLIAYQENEYHLAINYFLNTYLTYSKHQIEDPVNAYWMQNAITNIGLCYRYLKDHEKALKYFKYAFVFSSKQAFEKERPLAVISTNIGATYFNLEKYDSAIYFFKWGIQSCLKPKNNELAHGINSQLFLSKIYRKAGNLKLAHEVLEEALANMKKFNNTQFYGSYLLNLAEIQFAEKKFETAFKNQRKYIQFKDSIQNLDNKIVVGKQFLAHELERERDNNIVLENENRIIGLKQKIYLGLIISVLLILGVSILNYFKLNTKNKELIELNQQILAQKEDLKVLYEKLAQINTNKSYLMQSIAHDLRAPIGNIMGLNELMMAETDEHSELTEYFPLIQGSCLLSINIIEDILDQSMIEKGKFDLHKNWHAILPIVKESINILEFKSAAKKIKIISNFSDDAKLFLDSERMKRVFINIIMNAIKYSPRNSSIEVNQSIQNQTCIIEVKDYGIGMENNTLAKIFDKNTTARKEGTEHEATVGIGLSITKLIVEGHGGNIRVESKPNSGSSFYI